MKEFNLNLNNFLSLIAIIPNYHIPSSKQYSFLSNFWEEYIQSIEFDSCEPIDLGFLGNYSLTPFNQGKVKQNDLFYLSELIIFLYYWKNKNSYKNILDLGANVGIHSMIMSKLGWNINSYEPTQNTRNILKQNLKKNNANNVIVHDLAVSNHSGVVDFYELEDNLTGNFIADKKSSIHGNYKISRINTIDINSILDGIDLIKMDIEGSEADCITHINNNLFDKIDIFCEISSEKNATLIYEYANNNRINIFSQKIGWEIATSIQDLPVSWRDGNVFISKKIKMDW